MCFRRANTPLLLHFLHSLELGQVKVLGVRDLPYNNRRAGHATLEREVLLLDTTQVDASGCYIVDTAVIVLRVHTAEKWQESAAGAETAVEEECATRPTGWYNPNTGQTYEGPLNDEGYPDPLVCSTSGRPRDSNPWEWRRAEMDCMVDFDGHLLSVFHPHFRALGNQDWKMAVRNVMCGLLHMVDDAIQRKSGSRHTSRAKASYSSFSARRWDNVEQINIRHTTTSRQFSRNREIGKILLGSTWNSDASKWPAGANSPRWPERSSQSLEILRSIGAYGERTRTWDTCAQRMQTVDLWHDWTGANVWQRYEQVVDFGHVSGSLIPSELARASGELFEGAGVSQLPFAESIPPYLPESTTDSANGEGTAAEDLYTPDLTQLAPMRRFRIMVLGQERVGKTSLIKSLAGCAFDASEPSTQMGSQCMLDQRSWVMVDGHFEQEEGCDELYEALARCDSQNTESKIKKKAKEHKREYVKLDSGEGAAASEDSAACNHPLRVIETVCEMPCDNLSAFADCKSSSLVMEAADDTLSTAVDAGGTMSTATSANRPVSVQFNSSPDLGTCNIPAIELEHSENDGNFRTNIDLDPVRVESFKANLRDERLDEAYRISVTDTAGQRGFSDLHHILLAGSHRLLPIVIFDLRQPFSCKCIDVDVDSEHELLQLVWTEAAKRKTTELSVVCREMQRVLPEADKTCLEKLALKLDKSQFTVGDRMLYWLRSIHYQTPITPILLIGTHKLALSEEEVAVRLKELDDLIADEPFRHQIAEIHTVENDASLLDCTSHDTRNSDSGVAAVRQNITSIAKNLPGMDLEYPVVYLYMLH